MFSARFLKTQFITAVKPCTYLLALVGKNTGIDPFGFKRRALLRQFFGLKSNVRVVILLLITHRSGDIIF